MTLTFPTAPTAGEVFVEEGDTEWTVVAVGPKVDKVKVGDIVVPTGSFRSVDYERDGVALHDGTVVATTERFVRKA